jgi:hypothetical protein
MLPQELERKVADLYARPLKVFCKRTDGRTAIMTVHDCIQTGSSYISIAADELDELLSKYLEERVL